MLACRFNIAGWGLCAGGAVRMSGRVCFVQAVVCVVVEQQCFGCIDGRV